MPKGSLEVQGEGHHLTVSDATTHRPLCWIPSWLKDVHTHVEDPEGYQTQTQNQANQDDQSKETQKKCPIKVIQTTKRVGLSLSVSAAAAKSLQSCLTPCDPIGGSPPGSPVPGILQARTLEWVAISFSNA